MENKETNFNIEKLKAEKIELENKKLTIEIDRFGKNKWINIDFFKSVIALIITLLIGFMSIPIIQNKKLKLEKDEAKINVKIDSLKIEFNKQKRIYLDSINNLSSTIYILNDSLINKDSLIIDNNLKLNLSKLKLVSYNSKIQHINKYLLKEFIKNYNPYIEEKSNAYENALSFLNGKHSGNLTIQRQILNDKIELKFNSTIYNPEALYNKIKFVELDLVTDKIDVNILNDTLNVSYSINQKNISKYTSPIFIILYNNKKQIYSTLYKSKQISDKLIENQRNKCKKEEIKIDISKLEIGNYKLRFGFFHQGSLIFKYNTPLFYQHIQEITKR